MQNLSQYIEDLRSQLTGEYEKDVDFLEDHYSKNEADPQARKAVNFLLITKLPEHKKAEYAHKLPLKEPSTQSLLELVQELIHSNSIEEAEKISSILLNAAREQIPEQGDTTGYLFKSPLELEFYRQRYNPTVPVLTDENPYVNRIYEYAGYILADLEQYEEARSVLLEALSRNPLNSVAAFEFAETYKAEGELQNFLSMNKICCELVYQVNDIARYFRNLGFYFIEEENWEMAAAAYFESMNWEESEAAEHQLTVISGVTGNTPEKPKSRDTFLVSLTDYGIPIPPNQLWLKSAKELFSGSCGPVEESSVLTLLTFISAWSRSTFDSEFLKVCQKIFDPINAHTDRQPKTDKECIDDLKSKASDNDSYAACALAYCYQTGTFCEESRQHYLEFLKKAAQMENPLAMFWLGHFELVNSKSQSALKGAARWLEKAAYAGIEPAQFEIANCYLQGIGVEENFDYFTEWNIQAANQGFAISHRWLGHAYSEGRFGCKDPDSAIVCYKRAAVHGDLDSQALLAHYYESGELVEKDKQQELFWLERAAEQGDVISQSELASYYLDSEPTEYNLAKAFQWNLRIANQGLRGVNEDEGLENIIAVRQYLVAVAFSTGSGVEEDQEKAFEWTEIAAKREVPEAQFDLGTCYKEGNMVEQNFELAMSWFSKAAHQGNPEAQYSLALYYQDESSPKFNKGIAIE